jgi:hypothetical protein
MELVTFGGRSRLRSLPPIRLASVVVAWLLAIAEW